MSEPSGVRGDARDAGMVTAELAVAIPAVVLVLLLCLAGLRAGLDQVRCVDAAHLAARALARGDVSDRVRQLALDAAPAGARVDLATRPDEVVVTVRATAGGWGGVVPSWELTATAAVPPEVGAP